MPTNAAVDADGASTLDVLERHGAGAFLLAYAARELHLDQLALDWLARDTVCAPDAKEAIGARWKSGG